MPYSRLASHGSLQGHEQGHELRYLATGPEPTGPGDPAPPDPDAEFIEGAYAEDELQSLDFDDAAGTQSLHEREPESDFDTLDDKVLPYVDVANASDDIEGVELLNGVDLSNEEPL
jgi:hypothetical protein